MMWIKYQILQNIIDGEKILIEKKVGHNEANLAIAEAEAYDGKITFEEDEESFEKEPLSIELGGTGAKTIEDARDNLQVMQLIRDEDTGCYYMPMPGDELIKLWHNPPMVPEVYYYTLEKYNKKPVRVIAFEKVLANEAEDTISIISAGIIKNISIILSITGTVGTNGSMIDVMPIPFRANDSYYCDVTLNGNTLAISHSKLLQNYTVRIIMKYT